MESFFRRRLLWRAVTSLGCVVALTATVWGESFDPTQESNSGLLAQCGCDTCTIDNSCNACGPCGELGCYQSPSCFTLADYLPGLKCRGISVGGWASAGIYANSWSNPNNNLPLRDEARGALDQMWIFAEKQVNTHGCGIDWGGRVDFMFGADAPYTQCGPDHNTLPMFEDAARRRIRPRLGHQRRRPLRVRHAPTLRRNRHQRPHGPRRPLLQPDRI